MVNFRSWQEPKSDQDKYDENRIMSVFPIDRGFLITMRASYCERDPGSKSFAHQASTFFATFEQANEIAHLLLHRSKRQLDPR